MGSKILSLMACVLAMCVAVILVLTGNAMGQISSNPATGGWSHRISFNITNSGSALTDYQVLVTLKTESLISMGEMRSDCADIRFTDSDGSTQLSFWLESGCNTISTKLWVKVPSIPSGGKTIYVYYGNFGATSTSNGAATFDFFDDFSTSTLKSEWTFWNPAGDDSYTLTERPGWIRIKVAGNSDTWDFVNEAPFIYTSLASRDYVLQTEEDGTDMDSANRHSLLAYIISFATGDQNKGYFGAYTSQTSVKFEADGFRGNTCDTGQTVHYTRFRKFGSILYYDWSIDGIDWNNCGSYTLPSIPPYWGLGGKSWGGSTGDSFNADFDYFMVRKYASPEPITRFEAEETIKKAGDSIDFGSGYVLLITKVDSGEGTVYLELQLDNRTIDDKILKKGDGYRFDTMYYWTFIIGIVDIYHDATGNYVILNTVMFAPSLSGVFDLVVSSVPQRAEIYIDGEYKGKTNRSIPVTDSDIHSLRLVLGGYDEVEKTFKFEQNEGEKRIYTPLNKTHPTSTPTLKGDVNGDGSITGIDAVWIDQYIVGERTGLNTDVADVNGDGSITGIDAVWIDQYVVGKRTW
ncbi:MAG TPA: DUF2341 domain-containing protein [Candidatus Methanoperedens sp.]